VAQEFDLVIRGGTIVDGSGGEPFQGDVAISKGKIAEIGRVNGKGREEIDAKGKIVTPGFVDAHTHFDGQAIWSSQLAPSSLHGVTTVVMGNCGVGFAPCRPQDHELLIRVMEGVEDIPEVVMAKGLTWDWETFPEYLNAVDSKPHDIDVAAQLPHSALRVYVMGERGANREVATPEDLAKMKAIAKEAVEAGAIGFATSRIYTHRTPQGEHIPSFRAAEEELKTIAEGLTEANRGVLQFVLGSTPDFNIDEELDLVCRVAKGSGRAASFSLGISNEGVDSWRSAINRMHAANENGAQVHAQVYPRPVGMIVGHELTVNPFCLCPTYLELNKLPFDQKIAELRKPEMRAKLLSEKPIDADIPLIALGRNFSVMYRLDAQNPDYEPDVFTSVANQAKAKCIDPLELSYDLLLEDNGHAMFFVALANYPAGSLDNLRALLQQKDVIVALGDGGAHYGMICDASYPTFLLTHWTRDRTHGRLSLPWAIKALAADPARLIGFHDRGLLAVGYKADVNVIDYDNLKLRGPYITYDLPAGGRRLNQAPEGFVATIVSGKVTYRNGKPTGELPGKLVRGQQPAPMSRAAD
jgi:N-acyl-D-amino-acid deacylase